MGVNVKPLKIDILKFCLAKLPIWKFSKIYNLYLFSVNFVFKLGIMKWNSMRASVRCTGEIISLFFCFSFFTYLFCFYYKHIIFLFKKSANMIIMELISVFARSKGIIFFFYLKIKKILKKKKKTTMQCFMIISCYYCYYY